MRKNAIKKVLFTLATLAALPARADDADEKEFRLMEELPIEQRVIVHKEVVDFLSRNPELAAYAKVIAVDKKGVIYVLDEKLVPLAKAGSPSCIGRE